MIKNVIETNDLTSQIQWIRQRVGNTPFQKLKNKDSSIYAKLEYFNQSGSIKDRAGLEMISKAIDSGSINPDTILVESSSGNLAIALATFCKQLNLEFIPVIDPNINKDYERTLRLLTKRIIKVEERDETGGFLLNRIKAAEKFTEDNYNSIWLNQYKNPDNWKAYHNGLAEEIIAEFPQLDYLFVAVSSGGTITGLSKRLKAHYHHLNVVGVDIEGSVIFHQPPKKRHLSGLGSSIRTSIIEEAEIDHIEIISHEDIVNGCKELFTEQLIFGGASTGASYMAIDRYRHKLNEDTVSLFICCDRGNAYLDNVYKENWLGSINC